MVPQLSLLLRMLAGLLTATIADAGVPGPVIGYPLVNTSLGQLRGVTQEYDGRPLHAFRGIRYTDPPVNGRRFLRACLVNESWSGVRNATGYGAVCIQNPADVSWRLCVPRVSPRVCRPRTPCSVCGTSGSRLTAVIFDLIHALISRRHPGGR
jgi:hypothetical protein